MTITVKLKDGRKLTAWNVISVIEKPSDENVYIHISDQPDKEIKKSEIDEIKLKF